MTVLDLIIALVLTTIALYIFLKPLYNKEV